VHPFFADICWQPLQLVKGLTNSALDEPLHSPLRINCLLFQNGRPKILSNLPMNIDESRSCLLHPNGFGVGCNCNMVFGHGSGDWLHHGLSSRSRSACVHPFHNVKCQVSHYRLLKVLWCHNIQVVCHSCDADCRFTNDQNSYIVTVVGILQTNHGDYFSNHLLFTSGVINSLTLLWTISVSCQDCDDIRAFGCSDNMHNKKLLRL
jgi:hypothetical protein